MKSTKVRMPSIILGFYATFKHAQIGLTDVTSEIHTLYLGQTDTNYNSQSWVHLIHWGGFSLVAWGLSETAKVVFIWFIFNMSCCLACSLTNPESFSLRWRSIIKSR